MAQESGSIAFGSTGVQAIPLNSVANPSWIMFFTGGPFSGSTTVSRTGEGYADANYQWAKGTYNNSYKEFAGSKCFVVLSGTSGTLALGASLSSFGSFQVNVNITTASASYTVFFICGD